MHFSFRVSSQQVVEKYAIQFLCICLSVCNNPRTDEQLLIKYDIG